MKVLWFEVTTPQNYLKSGIVVGGWQDALEYIVKSSGIELIVAFTSKKKGETAVVDGVTYEPINIDFSFFEKQRSHFTWRFEKEEILKQAKCIIEKHQPDLIHVFGTEWPFGLIAKETTIPVVLHIQGSIVPYNNALYPPNYNEITMYKSFGCNLRRRFSYWRSTKKDATRLQMEKELWNVVSHYMGRTDWDYALSRMLHPQSSYYHVEEALRPVFLTTEKRWKRNDSDKLILFSTGCSSFWKGPDMMLKTARILKDMNVDFEWQVAGNMSEEIKCVVEQHEKSKFESNNIKILGFLSPEEIIDRLCLCSMYVHTAYIENSPNSICEAQYLGVPIVSTNVGGISSLVKDGEEGKLVPANDPWQMAYAIIRLWKDKTMRNQFSVKSQEKARKRHDPNNILMQLMDCYQSVLSLAPNNSN